MATLNGSRTDENLRSAFSHEGYLNRVYLNFERAAEAGGYHDFAILSRAAAERGAVYASCHLDFLVAGRDPASESGQTIEALAAAFMAVIDDHTARYAGMARTARDEGFDDISGWFETLAKAGRARAREVWRVPGTRAESDMG